MGKGRDGTRESCWLGEKMCFHFRKSSLAGVFPLDPKPVVVLALLTLPQESLPTFFNQVHYNAATVALGRHLGEHFGQSELRFKFKKASRGRIWSHFVRNHQRQVREQEQKNALRSIKQTHRAPRSLTTLQAQATAGLEDRLREKNKSESFTPLRFSPTFGYTKEKPTHNVGSWFRRPRRRLLGTSLGDVSWERGRGRPYYSSVPSPRGGLGGRLPGGSRWTVGSQRECGGAAALCGGVNVVQPNAGLKRTGVNTDLLKKERPPRVPEDGAVDLGMVCSRPDEKAGARRERLMGPSSFSEEQEEDNTSTPDESVQQTEAVQENECGPDVLCTSPDDPLRTGGHHDRRTNFPDEDPMRSRRPSGSRQSGNSATSSFSVQCVQFFFQKLIGDAGLILHSLLTTDYQPMQYDSFRKSLLEKVSALLSMESFRYLAAVERDYRDVVQSLERLGFRVEDVGRQQASVASSVPSVSEAHRAEPEDTEASRQDFQGLGVGSNEIMSSGSDLLEKAGEKSSSVNGGELIHNPLLARRKGPEKQRSGILSSAPGDGDILVDGVSIPMFDGGRIKQLQNLRRILCILAAVLDVRRDIFTPHLGVFETFGEVFYERETQSRGKVFLAQNHAIADYHTRILEILPLNNRSSDSGRRDYAENFRSALVEEALPDLSMVVGDSPLRYTPRSHVAAVLCHLGPDVLDSSLAASGAEARIFEHLSSAEGLLQGVKVDRMLQLSGCEKLSSESGLLSHTRRLLGHT